jgi:membrane-associated protein
MTSLLAAPALMATPVALGPDWLNPETLISNMGAWAVVGVLFLVFAECGLLLGFFLPGDSLLFTVGMLVGAGTIDSPIGVVCLVISAAAILGNLVGYWIGAKAGPALFQNKNSKIFRQEYVDKTAEFFDKHGPRAIVLARFVPIVRTFITAMAGVGRMDFKVYMTYSAIGGVLWGTGVTLAGYFLGQVPFVRQNIDLILIGIVVLSLVPVIIEAVKHRSQKAAAAAAPVAEVAPEAE